MPPELLIRLEIEALLAEWAWRVDEGNAASASDLFCEDAEQNLMGAKSAGLPAIRAAFQRRQDLVGRASQHVISNVRITEIAGDFVHAQWVVTLFRSDDVDRPAVPFMVGAGKDRYRRMADGRLKIWRREVFPTFGG